ncbi:hypothetical protein JVX90_14240 [Gordonia sp. PDNC005]|uniref:hypothetical protein n=1 Tax=unclassified Gordonia (in: high G+C Gram-positive bacteria) TaxID=2657482 RepID=UPI001963C5C0|nr:hypothetical protein [Gordonia sp. PDNC005]QRY61569.1 hypothetical protein JVX90_14240 [Gordonia sp. PDNC005]
MSSSSGDFLENLPGKWIAGGVLTVYFVALGVRTVVAGRLADFTAVTWVGTTLAFLLLAVAMTVTVSSATSALTGRQAGVVCGSVIAAVAVVWGSAALLGSAALGPFQTMLSTATIVLVVLMMRGRLLLAWVVVAINTVVGVIVGPLTGSSTWLNAVLPRASFTMLFIATGAALLLAPQVAELHALSDRRRVDRKGVDDVREDIAARDVRIRRIDARVRPLLTKVVDGDPVTDDDVTDARLIEARLRDGIRGRALDVPRVRRAVWDARRSGVSVTVLDDGGLTELDSARADAVVDATALVLEEELVGLSGGDVVARIAPPGRDPIATVGVVSGSVRRRVELTADGRIHRVVET